MNNFIRKFIFLYDAILPKMLVNFRRKIFRTVGNFWRMPVIRVDKIANYREKGKHVFFGYYDVTPFSYDDKIILAIQVPLIERTPITNDEAEVGFYYVNSPEHGFISLGKTNTWCWQQGCRLQWYAGKSNQIVYNCMINGKYGSVIREVPSGKIIKEIAKPLYSIGLDGKWGLSLDFSRLQRLRPGYGYSILPDASAGNLRPDYNGIGLVGLETGEWRQLFSLKEISKIDPHKSMKGAEHYFNHIMFNPSGKKFLFFHLWMSKNRKRNSRLFVSDRDGKNLKLVNNSGSVSHYNWITDDEIISYSLVEKKKKYMYAIFDSRNGKIKYFGKNVPKGDGHPTFLNNKVFITDTYPDLLFQRSILKYNMKKDKTEVLARFNEVTQFSGEFRCDLHPRISHNEKMICVDRIFNNKRCVSLIPFNIDEL